MVPFLTGSLGRNIKWGMRRLFLEKFGVTHFA
jgi:hypothetical protein